MAKKASEHFRSYVNIGGPTVSTMSRKIIETDGLYFKDIDATLDVIFGAYAPTGKLPMTRPKGDEVLHVNSDGVCVSPNDVPGYDKDLYMPDAMKDENGKAYAYRDTAGNYYELGFGLEY